MKLRAWVLDYGIAQNFGVNDAVKMITDYIKEYESKRKDCVSSGPDINVGSKAE